MRWSDLNTNLLKFSSARYRNVTLQQCPCSVLQICYFLCYRYHYFSINYFTLSHGIDAYAVARNYVA